MKNILLTIGKATLELLLELLIGLAPFIGAAGFIVGMTVSMNNRLLGLLIGGLSFLPLVLSSLCSE